MWWLSWIANDWMSQIWKSLFKMEHQLHLFVCIHLKHLHWLRGPAQNASVILVHFAACRFSLPPNLLLSSLCTVLLSKFSRVQYLPSLNRSVQGRAVPRLGGRTPSLPLCCRLGSNLISKCWNIWRQPWQNFYDYDWMIRFGLNESQLICNLCCTAASVATGGNYNIMFNA